MNEWPAPFGFLNAPPGLPPAKARLFRVHVALPALGALMHAAQIFFFAALGIVWWLSAWSVVSVAWFAVAIWLIRRGQARLGLWAAYAEVGTHYALLSICLGTDAAYPLYAFLLAAVPFVAMDKDAAFDRVIAVAYAVFTLPALYWLEWRNGGPLLTIDPAITRLLFWMNQLGVLFAFIAITAYFSKTVDQAEEVATTERERSERLLRNILPDAIAERLKSGEQGIADHFDGATVLFADLVGFTSLSARISTHELIDMLNEVFSRFDALADKHGLEKIKTIGDAYMVVGGLPEPCDDHADRVVAMALDMADAIADYAEQGGHALGLRIGVHTGPVVAGVIGQRKFAYDLWGDTVNTASRMESHGEPGRVQVSEATATALSDAAKVEERGLIAVKGKGEMRTFWVSR